jgi:hypothetical protein
MIRLIGMIFQNHMIQSIVQISVILFYTPIFHFILLFFLNINLLFKNLAYSLPNVTDLHTPKKELNRSEFKQNTNGRRNPIKMRGS